MVLHPSLSTEKGPFTGLFHFLSLSLVLLLFCLLWPLALPVLLLSFSLSYWPSSNQLIYSILSWMVLAALVRARVNSLAAKKGATQGKLKLSLHNYCYSQVFYVLSSWNCQLSSSQIAFVSQAVTQSTMNCAVDFTFSSSPSASLSLFYAPLALSTASAVRYFKRPGHPVHMENRREWCKELSEWRWEALSPLAPESPAQLTRLNVREYKSKSTRQVDRTFH